MSQSWLLWWSMWEAYHKISLEENKSINIQVILMRIRIFADCTHSMITQATFQNSITFISEPTEFLYVQTSWYFVTEKMDWITFKRRTGYELWHQCLGHKPNQFIKLSIGHSIGLEKLRGKKFSAQWAPEMSSCMIGNCKLNRNSTNMLIKFQGLIYHERSLRWLSI